MGYATPNFAQLADLAPLGAPGNGQAYVHGNFFWALQSVGVLNAAQTWTAANIFTSTVEVGGANSVNSCALSVTSADNSGNNALGIRTSGSGSYFCLMGPHFDSSHEFNIQVAAGGSPVEFIGAYGGNTKLPYGQVSITSNGAASTPIVTATGTWFSGGTATTTKPQVLIEPSGTASTAWNTSGTGLGINAATAFAGNLIDAQVAAVSKFSVGANGFATSATGFGVSPTAVVANGVFATFFAEPFAETNGIVCSAANGLTFTTGNSATTAATMDTSQNVVLGVGSLATNATNGFVYIPKSAGAPTGTPTAKTGFVAMQYDATNHKLWIYDTASSSWKGVALA